MKAVLVCRVRPGSTATFPIEGEEAVLGRDPGLAVTLAKEGVSRRHARITFDGKSYWLEDLASTNGTFLNGQQVARERLRHLDVITLGKKADLLFTLSAAGEKPVKVVGIRRAVLTRNVADALPYEIGVGEMTVGRSNVCNVVAEHSSVSKIHVRISRTSAQLLLQDLGSSNGTFVNGVQIMTAILRDGDVISLAGEEEYRVSVETGEVLHASGIQPLPPSLPEDRPRFSTDWRTRLEWDSGEYAQIAEAQRLAVERETMLWRPGKPAAATPRAASPAAKRSAAAAAQPPAAPAAPAKQPPAAPPPAPPTVSRAAAPAPTPAPPTSAPAPPVSALAPPSATPVASAAAPAVAAPPAAPMATAPAGPAATRPLAEVRLAGSGFDFVIAQPGAHELGRAKEASLRVNNPTVSRRHARVILSEDRTTAYVQHQGGANGTRLNGVEVEDLRPLSEGDVIGMGEVELKVSLKRA